MRMSPLVDRIGGERADAWAIHGRAAQMAREGRDVILLTVGDSDQPTPGPVAEASIEALRAGRTKYSATMGERRFREAIAARQTERWGLPVAPERVAIMTGAQGALGVVALCTLAPGDEVIVLEPMYVTYEAVAGLAGAELVMVPMRPENGFLPDPADIAAAVTPRTRAILYASPNNPTGMVLGAEHIAAIADLALKHDLWIIADEVYGSLVYRGEFHSPAADPRLVDRSIILSSLSKSHAMAGWRMGWAILPESLIPHIANVLLCTSYGLSSFLQEGAALAMEQELQEVTQIRETYRRRLEKHAPRLDAMPGLSCLLPPGGMFLMPDVRGTGLSPQAYADGLLDQEGVSVLPAEAFGDSATGHVRISIGAPDDRLDEAIDRIERYTRGLMSGRSAAAQ